jgi:hypothetical protein
MLVLTHWIRERYTWDGKAHHQVDPPPIDLQVALTALGRRKCCREGADQLLDLHQTDLRGVNLINAKMHRSNFSGAHLESADLSGANLEYADLSGANLSGANLKGTKLNNALTNSQTNVTDAVCDKNTDWPEGFDHRGAISQNN